MRRVIDTTSLRKPEFWLVLLFSAVVYFRFLLTFYINPMDFLFSDMYGKHWKNGVDLFDPNLLGSISPKLYFVWIFLINKITGGNELAIVTLTGLLSASMPWLWYKGLRELFSKRVSLLFAIGIGLTPSLLMIYGYFMNETLLLNLLGLSFWMTFRSLRKQSFASYNIAVLCWLLAAITRVIALPMALLATAYIFYHQRKKLECIASTILILFILAVPAGMHSYNNLRIFAPFHFTAPNEIYRMSGTKGYGYNASNGENYNFQCPSFYTNPLDPIGRYETYRKDGRYVVNIDLRKGRQDWQAAIERARKGYTAKQFLQDFYENAVYLLFSHSWPDGCITCPEEVFKRIQPVTAINYHARWMWAPLMALVLALAPFVKFRDERVLFFVLVTYVTLLLLIFQNAGVMEGRFRKPLEPMLLITAPLVISRIGRRKEGKTLLDFVRTHYVAPLRSLLPRAANNRSDAGS